MTLFRPSSIPSTTELWGFASYAAGYTRNSCWGALSPINFYDIVHDNNGNTPMEIFRFHRKIFQMSISSVSPCWWIQIRTRFGCFIESISVLFMFRRFRLLLHFLRFPCASAVFVSIIMLRLTNKFEL